MIDELSPLHSLLATVAQGAMHTLTCDNDKTRGNPARHVHQHIPDVLSGVGCLVSDSLQLLQEACVYVHPGVHVFKGSAVWRINQKLLEVLNPVFYALQQQYRVMKPWSFLYPACFCVQLKANCSSDKLSNDNRIQAGPNCLCYATATLGCQSTSTETSRIQVQFTCT